MTLSGARCGVLPRVWRCTGRGPNGLIKMRKIVNIHYLSKLFDPLFLLSDQETEELSLIDFNNELATKTFFQKHVVNNFAQYGPKSKMYCKDALQYILCAPADLHRFPELFPYGELPVEALGNTKLFFTWLWEELFLDQTLPSCIDEFIINNDCNAPNSVLIK